MEEAMPLETVLELARAFEPEPHLVEVARSAGDPSCSTKIYVWSTGQLAAAVRGDRLRIQRCLSAGLPDDAGVLELSAPELVWLVEVCRDWQARRTGWAAFWATRSPPHQLGFSVDHFQEPGKRGRVHSARRAPGTPALATGGREVVRRRAPIEVAPDTQIIAELWQVEVQTGTRDRVQVGVRYRGPTLRVDARRRVALIARPREKGGLLLRAGDEAFLASLR
jgi:hypothetical protein